MNTDPLLRRPGRSHCGPSMPPYCFETSAAAATSSAATAAGAYRDQAPATVATELLAAAAAVSKQYGGIEGPQWDRPGRRGDGSVFTVDSLSRYHLHDVEHQLHDVS